MLATMGVVFAMGALLIGNERVSVFSWSCRPRLVTGVNIIPVSGLLVDF